MKMKAINFHRQATFGLDELAKITGLTIAEMVRRGIDEYLEKEFAKLGRPTPNADEIGTTQ